MQLDKTLSISGAVLGFCAAFWPLGLWYIRRLADGGDEPLGVIVLAILAVIIFLEKKPTISPPNKKLMMLSLPVVASLQFYLGYPMRLLSAETTRWLVWPFVNDIIREGTTLSAYGKVVGVDSFLHLKVVPWISQTPYTAA